MDTSTSPVTEILAGKGESMLHALDIVAGVVVADQRHDALGKTMRDIHGHHG